MRLVVAMMCFWMVAGPAAAERHANCDAAETAGLDAALGQAKALTLNAAVSVGPSDAYKQWFGRYSRRNAEDVRATYKAVFAAIKSGAVRTRCEPQIEDTCASGAYAFVYPTLPYMVHICPRFFELPSIGDLNVGSVNSEFGSRGGTFIHELSHFRLAADTEDHCYGRAVCHDMAQDTPRLAVKNADSYQYFAEDVIVLVPEDNAGKPPPSARP